MDEAKQKIIEPITKRLLSDHLFDPTNKSEWIDKLIKEGVAEENAKHAYKIAARKYHLVRNEEKNKKSNSGVGKLIGYTGASIFTFGIMPWVYLILVLLAIALLGFVFGF